LKDDLSCLSGGAALRSSYEADAVRPNGYLKSCRNIKNRHSAVWLGNEFRWRQSRSYVLSHDRHYAIFTLLAVS
jgi:hypothetical protein